jgi:hypothetical protein
VLLVHMDLSRWMVTEGLAAPPGQDGGSPQRVRNLGERVRPAMGLATRKGARLEKAADNRTALMRAGGPVCNGRGTMVHGGLGGVRAARGAGCCRPVDALALLGVPGGMVLNGRFDVKTRPALSRTYRRTCASSRHFRSSSNAGIRLCSVDAGVDVSLSSCEFSGAGSFRGPRCARSRSV